MAGRPRGGRKTQPGNGTSLNGAVRSEAIRICGRECALARPPSFDALTDELIGALQEEVAAIKEGGGGDRFALRDGRFTSRTGERWLYAFLADSELSVPADSPGQLLVGGDAACDAVVVAVQGFEVTLALAKDLGEGVPTAVLVTAPCFLLETLARRLDEARQGRLPANRHLALALLDEEPARSLTPPSPPKPPRPPQTPTRPPARAAGAHAERPPQPRATGGHP